MPEGGEFRLTWGRLAAIVTVLAALIGMVPLYWTISDHWMNRVEIEKRLKDHADHDAGVQAWNSYNFAQNRVEYLDDRQAECEAKTLTQTLTPADTSICARYKAKLDAKVKEAAELRAKAGEATKEK